MELILGGLLVWLALCFLMVAMSMAAGYGDGRRGRRS